MPTRTTEKFRFIWLPTYNGEFALSWIPHVFESIVSPSYDEPCWGSSMNCWSLLSAFHAACQDELARNAVLVISSSAEYRLTA